jgi:hypothetical protein
MWAFDMSARASEYTAAEKEGEGHFERAGDFLFNAEGGSISNKRTPALSLFFGRYVFRYTRSHVKCPHGGQVHCPG